MFIWIIFILNLSLPDSFGFDNVAVNRSAFQSANLTSPSIAVDGQINQRWPSVSATKFGTFVWWYVNLGAPRNIHNITIYYRKENDPATYSARFAGFSLYISNTGQTSKGGYNCRVNSQNPPTTFPAVCTYAGQYVTLYNERQTTDGLNYGAILELGEVQVFGCLNATVYGTDCNTPCSSRCRNRLCNILNGTCFSCNDGYQGIDCTQICSSGKYGENCQYDCNSNCNNPMLCNNVHGTCVGGCKPGWKGNRCDQSCDDGKYGQSCLSDCGNCKVSPCNKVNGSCPECLPGYYPTLCNIQCSAGFYGQNCQQRCSGNCKNNVTCDFGNGYCSSGCKDGWTNASCSAKCPSGSYGSGCASTCSNNCKNGPKCHHVTGTCDQGCKTGFYGLQCIDSCSGNCKNNAVCNNSTGECSDGCAAGWKTEKCNKECDPGEYGENCVFQCGNCKNGTTCDIRSGYCESGCGPGYTGQFCKTVCGNGLYGEDCSNNCSGNCLNSAPCNVKTGVCDGGCAAGYKGTKCDEKCDVGFYGLQCKEVCSLNCLNNDTCNFVNGSCPRGCIGGWISDTCTQKQVRIPEPPGGNQVGPIIGVVCGVVVVMVIVVVVVFVIRRRKPKKESGVFDKEAKNGSNSSTNQLERKSAAKYHEEGNMYQNAAGLTSSLQEVTPDIEDNDTEETYYNTAPKPSEVYKDIKIEDLHKNIQDMLKNEKAAFVAQYEGIPKGEEHPCDAGKKQENIPKNRFKTTFPYDHSRVILKSTTQQMSDYINANYIENVEGKRTYIAAQGPKPNTVADFWRMVWQENVQKIVMVTNLKEGAKLKCEKYWPNIGETMKKGDITIQSQEEKHYAFYTIRKLKITKQGAKEDRLLYHFHYTQWMDHDVPDSVGLVVFHRHVMRTAIQQKNSLTTVHCSAGIGRTGTYIALDALYRDGKETGKVNVPAYVKVMRKDRMSMIQNVDQYITVFKALDEAFRGKYQAIPREKFLKEVEDQNDTNKPENSKNVRTTFHELQSLKTQYTKNDYKAGRENIDANFTKTVIPVDKFRCNLFSYSKGRGSYYNAVVMQSYIRKDGLISAQFPLPTYTEDFLRLVHDFESHIVVSLNPLNQVESTNTWMPVNHSGVTVGDFKVYIDSKPQTIGSVKSTTLSLKKEEFDKHALEVLESTSWNIKDALPAEPKPVLELVTQVQKVLKSNPDSVIIVLSEDGASKCGLFCAVFNALQQVGMDDEVDIFTIVRQLQIRRPEMFSSMDEYQFCFKTVAEYSSNPQEDGDNIYANC